MAINKKLITFATKAIFTGTSGTNGATTAKDGYYGNIPERAIVFILDTNEIWTHGKYFSGGIWGTKTNNYVPLTINGSTYNLSLDGHTHSLYLTSHLDLSAYLTSAKAADTYVKKIGDMPSSAYDIIISPTNVSGSDYIDAGGGILVKGHTGTLFQLWLHDTSNVWYKKTSTGNWAKMDAGCADQLMTARNINGTSFNGTADITTSIWGTTRNITIGSTTKAVNGSANVSWSLSEIGAAASSHNHDGRYVYNYANTDCKNASLGSSYMGMTTSSGIDSNWWHIINAGWNGEYRWNSLIGFPTLDRALMYFRSGKDDNSGWGAWKRLALYSEIPSSLKNPNSLSWSGYSSGSYDGSSALSISIPSNTNQLTNGAGFTTNTGTVTSVAIKMNSTTKGTITSSGTIDLGTVITAHQDISGKSNTSHTHSVKINGTTKTIAASGGTAVDLGTYLTSHLSLNGCYKWLGNPQKGNMNDIARIAASTGMTELKAANNTTDNPYNGTTESTSWHLYFNTCYTDGGAGSNSWVAQIANKAGTNLWWVRSRNGGTVTNGTVWAAPWRHLVTSDVAGVGSATLPVYVDASGLVTACSYTIQSSVPSNAKFTDTVYTLPTATTSALGGVKSTAISMHMTDRDYYAEVGSDGKICVNIPWTDTNTKNTAGSTNTSSKIYLIGATSQAANPQTYSNSGCYINTNGQLVSNGSVVITEAGGEVDELYCNGSITIDDELIMNDGTIQTNKLKLPTTSGGSTYGVGSSGQVLKSNGSTVYWANDNNTTYSAGSGLSLSGTTFGHASSITAGTVGTSSATSGITLAVPYVTYNSTGHITAVGTHTHTIPVASGATADSAIDTATINALS